MQNGESQGLNVSMHPSNSVLPIDTKGVRNQHDQETCFWPACFAAFSQATQAANLSSNGVGQALVFPYYTVNGGQQTLLSVVNTSLIGKVVKVRFREAKTRRCAANSCICERSHQQGGARRHA